MREPFVLRRPGGARWVVHPPEDPYGDGYVFTVATELHEDGMTASTVAMIDGLCSSPDIVALPVFLDSLAAGWEGWQGVRTWTSMERELCFDARHDGRGYVSLGVTLRPPGFDPDDTGWSARAVFVLEAGEEMTQVAADLSALLQL
ncbi:DUF6228 family protein [Micromonospora antibiotica]|uniref:Uncharacterized protein n=1 Tax=Micromonospora antibiotica TaxID=2807623 RepID=A0ABS3V1S6_9ACTN|nr:DUF6228 family protein [Micromonospora antibiotica]MBO4159562.1 hypothetical protein [Micromonospora antibiotica]